MKTIGIYRENNMKYTMVPDIFIEKYMVQASGEFVKVYLLLLKGLPDEQYNLSVSSLADVLQCTDNDVIRALKYWENQELLQLDYEGQELSSIKLVDLSKLQVEPRLEKVSPVELDVVETEPIMPTEKSTTFILPPKSTQKCEDEEFGQLMYLIQQYMGAPIGPTECEKYAYFYEDLGMSAHLLEFLVEYCVTNGHKSIRYIESVAVDWHKREIKTVEAAKAHIKTLQRRVYAVMKAFGLQGRQAIPEERRYIERWFKDYKLTEEVIVEGCTRTVLRIHQTNFDYTDRILEGWSKRHVKNLDDVKKLDEEYRQKKEKEKKEKEKAQFRNQPSVKAEVAKTRFHNFEQRDTDYDAILKEISGSYY